MRRPTSSTTSSPRTARDRPAVPDGDWSGAPARERSSPVLRRQYQVSTLTRLQLVRCVGWECNGEVVGVDQMQSAVAVLAGLWAATLAWLRLRGRRARTTRPCVGRGRAGLRGGGKCLTAAGGGGVTNSTPGPGGDGAAVVSRGAGARPPR